MGWEPGGKGLFLSFGHLINDSSGQQAVVLQEARVPIISNEVCNSADFYGNQIKPKMFCAGYPEGGIDACQVRDTVGSLQAQHYGGARVVGK